MQMKQILVKVNIHSISIMTGEYSTLLTIKEKNKTITGFYDFYSPSLFLYW